MKFPKLTRRRWGDHDHYFGPFTFARDQIYKTWAIILSSAEEEDYCKFRISAFHCTFITALPNWVLRPERKKVVPDWDAATVERLGRNWYWDLTRREFGISYNEGFLQIPYGRQTMDSRTEQRWSCFLPWTEWRFVRHSVYDLFGALYADLPQGRWVDPTYEEIRRLEDACPTVTFRFYDFDGELIEATTRIEEREWLFGTGWFKWLSWFRKPKVRRDLYIMFSAETGKRKGSWKGGTVGHSINMHPDELHMVAFMRYCDEHGMTFIGVS